MDKFSTTRIRFIFDARVEPKKLYYYYHIAVP